MNKAYLRNLERVMNQITVVIGNRKNWLRQRHPVFDEICNMPNVEESTYNFVSKHWPKCVQRLVLEQPRIPENGDAQRVAYWQSDEKQGRDLATVAPLGRYLKRHFPTMEDHEIRDLVALFAPVEYKLLDTMEDIIHAVQNGPHSCMKFYTSSEDGECLEHHPYRAYDPKYGWRMMVQKQGERIVGRALVNGKDFVRAYRRDPKEPKSSCNNDEMVAWMKSNGYTKRNSWVSGTELAFVEKETNHCGAVLPYLDGDNQCVVKVGDCWEIVDEDEAGDYQRSDHTVWDCTSQWGNPSVREEENLCECPSCGNMVHQDDIHFVGPYYEQSVCQGCFDDYTYVTGRRRDNYYIYDDRVIYVDGEAYDVEYLSDNDIVRLHDGDYAMDCDTVLCESNDEYYLEKDLVDASNRDADSYDVVYVSDGYYLVRDCRWCEYNEKWIHEDDATGLNNGEYVHEDDWLDYLVTLTEDEVRERVSDEDELEEVFSSVDWQYEKEQA